MGAGDYDVAKADELGFSIKLLGIASRIEPFEGDPGFEEDPFRPCVGEEAPDVPGVGNSTSRKPCPPASGS